MLLVFRIFRSCIAKGPSTNLYYIGKTDKNDALNYLIKFASFYTNYARFTQPYHRLLEIEHSVPSTSVTEIDEPFVGDSMAKSIARKRRRRSKLLVKQITTESEKPPSKKKRASKKKNKKTMNNFWFNYQTNAPFLNSGHGQPFENTFLNQYGISQFPPLNHNLVLNHLPLMGHANYTQYSYRKSKSYSDVAKSVRSLHSEGTNLKQFLAETRQEVYTPYGEWVKEGWYKDKTDGGGVFVKVLSYNILAQNLLDMHPHLYKHHNKQYLNWEYRKAALLKEFEQFDADIICLQEVEGKETDFFSQHLESLGYKGIYKKRTNDKEDGCAIYYRVEKFELKEYATVEYYQPGIQLLDRDNIGLIARLSFKESPDKNIVVANTHLLFNPRRHDIKLAQIQMLLAELDRVAFRSSTNGKKKFTSYHPVVLVGDFNLKPFTHVYELIVNGYLDNIRNVFSNQRFCNFDNPNQLMPMHLGITDACQHYEVVKNRIQSRTEISDFKFVRLFNSDRKSLSLADQNLERGGKMNYRFFGSGCLYHNLNFTSVYPHDDLRVENATTFQDDWCNVDYIFYGPQRRRKDVRQDGDLKLVSYLKLPTKQEAETLKYIPNEACASDHLPLLATFFLPTV